MGVILMYLELKIHPARGGSFVEIGPVREKGMYVDETGAIFIIP